MMNQNEKEAQTRGAEVPIERERGRARRLVHVPRVDVSESKDAFLVVAELPGVGQDGVEITIEKNVLTIAAKAEARAPEGYQRLYGAEPAREYQRVFTLTDAVDRDAIRAAMKNGVLHLTLPKASESRPRRITVQADA
jgi:HSP20 family molecular chaperone IbpA